MIQKIEKRVPETKIWCNLKKAPTQLYETLKQYSWVLVFDNNSFNFYAD